MIKRNVYLKRVFWNMAGVAADSAAGKLALIREWWILERKYGSKFKFEWDAADALSKFDKNMNVCLLVTIQIQNKNFEIKRISGNSSVWDVRLRDINILTAKRRLDHK